MKLVIKDYWNRVTPDKDSPFGTRVEPDFILKSSLSYPNETRTVKEFQHEAKHRHDFMEFVTNGAKFSTGKSYGIASYQIVTIEP